MQLSRDAATPHDLDSTLRRLVSTAHTSIPDVDHVSLSLRLPGDDLETVAATDEVAVELGWQQVELGEGPCLHVVRNDELVQVDGLPDDGRWPRFSAWAAGRGIRSYVGARFQTEDRSLGVLSMWSATRDALSAETVQLAELFAAHAGLALGHARRIDHLNQALRTRTVIGVAIGMVMQRLDLDEDTAFAYLTRISSSTETKLRDVAASMVQAHHDRLLTQRGDHAEPDPA